MGPYRKFRMRFSIIVVALLLASAVLAGAGLLDDAKDVLNRLNNVGDVGRAGMAEAVGQARQAAERIWPDTKESASRKRDEARNALAKARRDFESWKGGVITRSEQRGTDIARGQREITTGLVAARKDKEKAFAQVAAQIETAEQALRWVNDRFARAEAAGQQLASDAGGIAAAAVNDTTSWLQTRANGAKDALRGVIPQPVGTRPPTRTERRCVTVLGAERCSDVAVPNDASEGELRNAINAGAGALSDIGKAGELARRKFESRISSRMQDVQNWSQELFAALARAIQAANDARMALVKNMR